MSWELTPSMSAEEMTRKLREWITEISENARVLSVSDLGDFNDEVILFWAEELVDFGFKILRNAKAAQLLGNKSKVDRGHVTIAINQLTKQSKPINK